MSKIIGVHIPDGIKNYLINGDMAISQRGTSFAAIATGVYSLDRYRYIKTGAMVHTITQDTDVPSLAQSGYLFRNSLRLNLTTPDTSIAAGDFASIQQYIEGYNWANLAQKNMTVSFWVKATLPGTYCMSFVNTGNDRSYIAEYTISGASTWEYKTITIPASPSAGTWNYTNGIGLRLSWNLVAGTTYQTTAGAWQTGNFLASNNQTNGTNTGATDFRLTGVMLNEGTTAFPFRLFGTGSQDEMVACERYYEKSYDYAFAPGSTAVNGFFQLAGNANGNNFGTVFYKTRKRSQSTVTYYNPVTGTSGELRNVTTAANAASSALEPSETCFHTAAYGNGANDQIHLHWVADSEL